MNALYIFLFQAFATSLSLLTVYFGILVPWLRKKPASIAFTILLLPNLWRHIGFSSMSPVVVSPEFAQQIGPSVAFGDFFCLVSVYLALILIWRRQPLTLFFCWSFVVLGFLHDIDVSWVMLRVHFSAVDQLGGHWYVATFVVPIMVLSEILMLWTLLTRSHDLKNEFSRPVTQ